MKTHSTDKHGFKFNIPCEYLRLFLILFFLFQINAADADLISLFPIENYDQNITHWIKPSDPDYDKPLLTREQQQKRLHEFYNHVFATGHKSLSPWSEHFINLVMQTQLPPNDLKNFQKDILFAFDNSNIKDPNHIRLGENFRPLTSAWIQAIADNMNINQFNPPFKYKAANRAIILNNVYARALPSDDPAYYNYKIAGQGYPFDYLQESAIWVGTPVYILGVSRDGGWTLVLTPSYVGWITSTAVARVDESFVKKWQHAAKENLGAIIHTKTSVIDTKGHFRFYAYMGAIFPMVSSRASTSTIMIPLADKQHKAYIGFAKLNSSEITTMPLRATPHNISILMQDLLGKFHGWGNVHFYNDCSSTMVALYTPLGIWLPRHSARQVYAGKLVDMTNANVDQRLNYLLKNGKKMMTIIYIGKHILMYMGKYVNPRSSTHELMAMTFQTKWGLKTPADDSRIIIGKTVVFPLLKQYPENPNIVSLANEEYFRVSYLDHPSSYPPEDIFVNFKRLTGP